MKTQLSEKQLAANRANAARSTGPRSAEGKARAAMNARKHGFCGSTYSSVSFEELEMLDRLRDDAITDYQPITAQEIQAVERIAIHQLQMLRAARLDAGLFEASIRHGSAADRPSLAREWPPMPIDVDLVQRDNLHLADGFDILLSRWKGWQIFLRYQAQAERLYRRAVEDFERLKAQREDLPNEPILETQPEQNEEMEAPPNEPISTPAGNPPAPGPSLSVLQHLAPPPPPKPGSVHPWTALDPISVAPAPEPDEPGPVTRLIK